VLCGTLLHCHKPICLANVVLSRGPPPFSYRASIQAFWKLVTQLIPAFFFESPVLVV
jgi:hypothetical protein